MVRIQNAQYHTYVNTMHANKTALPHRCINIRLYLIVFVEVDNEMLVDLLHGYEQGSSLLPPTIVCRNLT